MPYNYLVSCKEGLNQQHIDWVKDFAKEKGGKVDGQFSLLNLFRVSFDYDAFTTMQYHDDVDHVEIEQDVQ